MRTLPIPSNSSSRFTVLSSTAIVARISPPAPGSHGQAQAIWQPVQGCHTRVGGCLEKLWHRSWGETSSDRGNCGSDRTAQPFEAEGYAFRSGACPRAAGGERWLLVGTLGNERCRSSRPEVVELGHRLRAMGERTHAHSRPHAHPLSRGVREPALRDAHAVVAKPFRQLNRGLHRLEGAYLDPVRSPRRLILPRRSPLLTDCRFLHLHGGSSAVRGRCLAGEHGELKLWARFRRAPRRPRVGYPRHNAAGRVGCLAPHSRDEFSVRVDSQDSLELSPVV